MALKSFGINYVRNVWLKIHSNSKICDSHDIRVCIFPYSFLFCSFCKTILQMELNENRLRKEWRKKTTFKCINIESYLDWHTIIIMMMMLKSMMHIFCLYMNVWMNSTWMNVFVFFRNMHREKRYCDFCPTFCQISMIYSECVHIYNILEYNENFWVRKIICFFFACVCV